LEEFFQKDQALIAKFVEECYEIHGGSSVGENVGYYMEPLEVYPGVIWC